MKRRVKKSTKKRKSIKYEIRWRALIFSTILTVGILISIFRFHLVTVCDRVQHTDNCCPLANQTPINNIGDEEECKEN